ncbi:hypothetical protein DL96DRAFT_309717 [Flagelloscypha sp. PMI_526]|nr:hypothetical protein DL96DRAFT_309717 [Flagelloscypha sp. PMI_526]
MKFTTVFATAMLLLVPTVLASPHRRQDEDTTDVEDPTNIETFPSVVDTATATDPAETDTDATGSVTIPEGTGTPSVTATSAPSTGVPSVSVPTTSRPATTTTPATTSKPATTSSASSTSSGNAAAPTGKVEGLAVAGIIAGVLAAMV